MKRHWQWIVVGVIGAVALAWFVVARRAGLRVGVCFWSWREYGLSLKDCPDGRLRQTVSLQASGLQRNGDAVVFLGVTAHYTSGGAEDPTVVSIPRFDARLALVDAAGNERPLTVTEWTTAGEQRRAALRFPDVPDGDYVLRGHVRSRIGESTVDFPLPLYAPARVHVITDRPLYEPGNTLQFRAVLLRASDLAPLDGRPGTWVVTDPNGEVLLEEKVPAGEFGVAAGSFPLDRGAENGTWTIRYQSGDASDQVSVAVEPFTLPRFRVEVVADQPFYRAGDKPLVNGAVLYSSGAPVAGATVEVTWEVLGDWPPPNEWAEGALPTHATTGGAGRFELLLPAIPKDLQGTQTLAGRVVAVDPAGGRVETQVALRLVEDPISATAVTELGDGLVEGFNNRVYIRVTTADGRPLPGAKVKVKRAWQATDRGVDTVLDEDSVAALQLDPGPAVNVVIPAKPMRTPPPPPVVTRGEPTELLSGDDVPLADLMAMDKWLSAVVPCAKWVDTAPQTATVALHVSPKGDFLFVGASDVALDWCTAKLLERKRLPAGPERLYSLTFEYAEPHLPEVTATANNVGSLPAGLQEWVDLVAMDVRDCFPGEVSEGDLVRGILWRATAGKKKVALSWRRNPDGVVSAGMDCVTRRASSLELDDAPDQDAMGVVWFSVSPYVGVDPAERPQPTVMLGYEFLVSVTDGTKEIGTTKLRLPPGQVPPLRLRATPILAKLGDEVTIELIRGPEFTGDVPEEVTVTFVKGRETFPVGKETRKTKFYVTERMQGWLELEARSARALVYVRPDRDMTVSLAPESQTYAPGQTANIKVTTLIGGKGGKAAVGLIGVDESLGQLVALPGPDDMGRVRQQVETPTPAFGVLDGQALALGRIRGANAAAATVLRVGAVPRPPEVDAVVSGSVTSPFDPVAELTDRFYIVLEELHVQVRAWEESAPEGEKMHPKQMAELWGQALAAVESRGESVADAYGRRLRLSRLPSDLLALTDPRQVVVVGTRLPEDVEPWAEWVAKEKP